MSGHIGEMGHTHPERHGRAVGIGMTAHQAGLALCEMRRSSLVAHRRDPTVRVVGIIADLHVADIESAKDFYSGYLGLSNEEFNMGWVARFTSPDTGANVQLVTHDAAASEDPVISVKVDDVDAAYEDATQRGYEIVHPLSTEPWGVRRFFVRAPDGNVVNIVQHRD
jgi:predicted enzyme related to lactoylglutathione lyase